MTEHAISPETPIILPARVVAIIREHLRQQPTVLALIEIEQALQRAAVPPPTEPEDPALDGPRHGAP